MEPEASKLVEKSKLDSQINEKRFMLELGQYSCPEQTTDIHVLQEEPKSNLQKKWKSPSDTNTAFTS